MMISEGLATAVGLLGVAVEVGSMARMARSNTGADKGAVYDTARKPKYLHFTCLFPPTA
jgi:hypothetical protein